VLGEREVCDCCLGLFFNVRFQLVVFREAGAAVVFSFSFSLFSVSEGHLHVRIWSR